MSQIVYPGLDLTADQRIVLVARIAKPVSVTYAHQVADLAADRWPARPVRVGPVPLDQPAVPRQQHRRGDPEGAPPTWGVLENRAAG